MLPHTYYYGRATGLPTRYAFLRHVNTNTLALMLFVALALICITRAKEPQKSEAADTRDAAAELAIGARHTSVSTEQEFTLRQSLAKSRGIKSREIGKDR